MCDVYIFVAFGMRAVKWRLGKMTISKHFIWSLCFDNLCVFPKWWRINFDIFMCIGFVFLYKLNVLYLHLVEQFVSLSAHYMTICVCCLDVLSLHWGAQFDGISVHYICAKVCTLTICVCCLDVLYLHWGAQFDGI